MKPWLHRITLTLMSSFLLACSSVPMPMLPVAAFGARAQTELLTLQAGEQIFAFTARVESDGQTLRVVAITPTGQRLFSLTRHKDELLTEPGPLWPQAMSLKSVWADFEITHAPALITLPAGWQRLNQNGDERWMYQGKKLAQVKHEDGKITLERPEYQLTIEVLPE